MSIFEENEDEVTTIESSVSYKNQAGILTNRMNTLMEQCNNALDA
ncbi:hypothetical protein [Salinibacillus aidingensis]